MLHSCVLSGSCLLKSIIIIHSVTHHPWFSLYMQPLTLPFGIISVLWYLHDSDYGKMTIPICIKANKLVKTCFSTVFASGPLFYPSIILSSFVIVLLSQKKTLVFSLSQVTNRVRKERVFHLFFLYSI